MSRDNPLELKDPWPVFITSLKIDAYALIVDADGAWNDRKAICVAKDSGAFYEVPLTEVRMKPSWTMGTKKEKADHDANPHSIPSSR